ncbi:hypothetical protein Tco_1255344 [Tanacetum coccineum]
MGVLWQSATVITATKSTSFFTTTIAARSIRFTMWNKMARVFAMEMYMAMEKPIIIAIAALEYPLPVKSRNPTEEPVQGIKSNTYLDRM